MNGVEELVKIKGITDILYLCMVEDKYVGWDFKTHEYCLIEIIKGSGFIVSESVEDFELTFQTIQKKFPTARIVKGQIQVTTFEGKL